MEEDSYNTQLRPGDQLQKRELRLARVLLLYFVMNAFVQIFVFLSSISSSCDAISINKISMDIIFKFEILK